MKHKVAVITGASGDIGREIVKKFARSGYAIVYHYNSNFDEQFVSDLCALVPVLAIRADISKKEDVEDFARQVRQVFGRVDVLVNNAGCSQTKVFLDENFSSINGLIQTDLVGTIYLTNLLLPLMECGSSIINISSIFGEIGGSMEVVYSAAKAGLIGFTKALSKEIGAMGIRVNAITPGLIETKMNSRLSKEEKQDFVESYVSLAKVGSPIDVAETVLFLASSKAKYINGQILGVNGGI